MKKKIFIYTFVPLFILYYLTSSSTVYWQDSGIFLMGVKTLGIIYPPGFSLYLMLAFLWTKIFSFLIPTIGFTKVVLMFSNFSGSLSAFIIAITTFDLYVWFAKTELMTNKKAVIPKIETAAYLSIITGLLAGLSYSLWSQSINAEVYSMISFFIALIFYFLCKLIIIFSTNDRKEGRSVFKYLLIILFLWGLSFSVHPLSVLLTPVFLFFGLKYKDRIRYLMNKKYILISTLMAVLGFLIPLLYLPIRSHYEPDFVWDRISGLFDLIKYISARSYFTGETSLTFINFKRMATYPGLLFSEVNIGGMLLMSIGIWSLLKQNNKKTLLQIIMLTAFIFYSAISVYSQGTEYNYWLIPVYNLFYILIGMGIWSMLGILRSLTDFGQKDAGRIEVGWLKDCRGIYRSLKEFTRSLGLINQTSVVIISGIILVSIPLLLNFKYNNRRDYTLSQVFGKNIIKNLPENSILITVGDNDSAITGYLQLVENYRRDIVLVQSNDFLNEWKMNRLRKYHSSIHLPNFSQDLKNSQRQYDQFTADFLKNNLKTGGVFLINRSVINVPEGFTIVPAGAIWKIVEKGKNDEAIDLKYWNYEFKGAKRYKKPEKDEGVKIIRNNYGIEVATERMKYSDEAKNFELQAYKNLADICYDSDSYGKPLLVINNAGVRETYLAGQLLICARDNYQKMIDLDPEFFRADIWERRAEIYQALGDEEKAREVAKEAAVKGNELKK